jgi:hypothetical protein
LTLLNDPIPSDVEVPVLLPDDEVDCPVDVSSALVLFVTMKVCIDPVLIRLLADTEVALDGLGVFVPVETSATLLVGVTDTVGIVEGDGTPRIETVPDKSIVEAAFTSALAVGGKP